VTFFDTVAVHRAAPCACRRQRGSVLLAVVILVAAAAAISAALVERSAQTAAELRVRRDVLCARYASLGGLALGTATQSGAAALIGPQVDSLVVSPVRLGPSWCVLRASASCGGAQRTIDRAQADTSACDTASH
jgi:hypothetical protein